MNRPKDRKSAEGLLPRMEARPWADGKTVTYRFHPVDGKPINLGTDKLKAVRLVADMTRQHDDTGTIARLWQQLQDSKPWAELGKRTRDDYGHYAAQLLPVFGHMRASAIGAKDVRYYLRKERASAPVRANREITLLGQLIGMAVEDGDASENPCRGKTVKRNKESARTRLVGGEEIAALVAFANTPQRRIVVMAAEFAALVGSRQMEFVGLAWSSIGPKEIRLQRGKQRGKAVRWERITISPALETLLGRLRAIAKDSKMGAVFPTRAGRPYTPDGFRTMWQRVRNAAVADGVITESFTFHDLRAHYATEHKEQTGELPDLHAVPATTARIYERSRVSKRKAL